VSYEIETE